MSRIPFKKLALSIPDQIAKLKGRGLIVGDVAFATHCLQQIGYYRLSGYGKSFIVQGSNPGTFPPGVTFEKVLDRYTFDRKLRLLVMDAIERVEVSVRSNLSAAIAQRHGPHWYLDKNFFGGAFRHEDWLEDVRRQIGHDPAYSNRRDTFIKHYYDKYDNPDMPPCWMIFECISLNSISMAFKYILTAETREFCAMLGLHHSVLSSWLHSVSYVRNLCAHHARLWNRIFTIKPIAAHAYQQHLTPNNRMYAQAVILHVLLSIIAPHTEWHKRLDALLDEHGDIPIGNMGFPPDWRNKPFWQLS